MAREMLSGTQQAGPRTATIEFDAELWDAIERAASRLGVGAVEYIQAVVARAAEDTGLVGGPDHVHRARLVRLAAVEAREEARALRAQGEQAVRRAQELAAVGGEVDPGLGNMAYVKLLWEVFKAGGVAAVAEFVPRDVEWRPMAGEVREAGSSQDVDEFWSSEAIERTTPTMFHASGDDVLVEAHDERDDGDGRTLWSLYRFRGGSLVEAIAFSDAATARSFHWA